VALLNRQTDRGDPQIRGSVTRRDVIGLMAGVVIFAGCLGTSPEERQRADLGSANDGNEEHRPGQPCLACHGSEFNPGGSVFEVAGTVYLNADDAEGLEGAEVSIIDNAGTAITARTNRVGNFMIQIDRAVDGPTQLGTGRTLIAAAPVFPLNIAVRYQGIDKSMQSLAWRAGSCATCHQSAQTGTDHIEKIWIRSGPTAVGK